jgi:hypothetical protein
MCAGPSSPAGCDSVRNRHLSELAQAIVAGTEDIRMIGTPVDETVVPLRQEQASRGLDSHRRLSHPLMPMTTGTSQLATTSAPRRPTAQRARAKRLRVIPAMVMAVQPCAAQSAAAAAEPMAPPRKLHVTYAVLRRRSHHPPQHSLFVLAEVSCRRRTGVARSTRSCTPIPCREVVRIGRSSTAKGVVWRVLGTSALRVGGVGLREVRVRVRR